MVVLFIPWLYYTWIPYFASAYKGFEDGSLDPENLMNVSALNYQQVRPFIYAGQPANVFSTDSIAEDGTTGVNMFQPPAHVWLCIDQLSANIMLDNWEENLAMITANRTKDDELVLIYLGDCLWKETSNIIAAHICYLVAEANFEPYSDSARLCLIGADHWKHPRTYASPEAIQSLLKGRFLRNQRFAEVEKQSSVAASDIGLLRKTHVVADIRCCIVGASHFLSSMSAVGAHGIPCWSLLSIIWWTLMAVAKMSRKFQFSEQIC
ncbi:COPII coat assembly protein, Sec16 [Artemisia annua]|uniref:COPII coat assembly protein, Sec16 n=1 Tax=Artemisia annua TaxID=35608 RepID=A0A2U1PVY8_ARTAN|nr:COPII coat assembly protein, Sec16 [Artemisia annua]